MRSTLLIAFALTTMAALSAGCAATRAAVPPQPPWLAANEAFVRDGVGSSVLIAAETSDRGSPAFHGGAGAVIDDDGHVLTSAHVVEGARSVYVHVRTFDPRTLAFTIGDALPADVVATAPEADAALLRVRDAAALPPPLAVAMDAELDIGRTVWFFGKPHAVAFGPVTAIGVPIDGRMRTIEVDAAAANGDSGAPLILPGAGIVGLLFGSSTDGSPSYFVPIRDVMNALGRARRP